MAKAQTMDETIPNRTKRIITTSRDKYGLDSNALHERLIAIIGSESGANDALAAFAEWLDTAKYAAHNFTKKTQLPKLPKKNKVRKKSIRYRVASVAAHFAEQLASELEAEVNDSEYALLETEDGQKVRRRVLRQIEN